MTSLRVAAVQASYVLTWSCAMARTGADGREPGRDLGAASGAKFGKDVRDVRRDSLGGQDELLGYLLVCEAVGDEPRDFEFAMAERVPRWRGPFMLHRREELCCRVGDGSGPGGFRNGAGLAS